MQAIPYPTVTPVLNAPKPSADALLGTGNSCERCQRLRKECRPSALTRKRLARRPASKAARLEEKLDDLVTLLKTQAATNPSAIPLASGHTLHSPQKEPQCSCLDNSFPACTIEHSLHSHLNGSTPPSHVRIEPERLSVASAVYTMPHSINLCSPPEPYLSEAEECLATFRTYHLQGLPFVHLPPELTYVNSYNDPEC
ncbi:Zn(II)2Cys6 transcription factor [Ilyonectria robusta]